MTEKTGLVSFPICFSFLVQRQRYKTHYCYYNNHNKRQGKLSFDGMGMDRGGLGGCGDGTHTDTIAGVHM